MRFGFDFVEKFTFFFKVKFTSIIREVPNSCWNVLGFVVSLSIRHVTWPLRRVTVVEKNGKDQAGGRLNEMTKGGDGKGDFRFDTGPSLLLLPDTYRETFKGAEDEVGV